MTHQEIDKLAAGRELDALIAEKVMGWTGFWKRGEPSMMAYPPVEQAAGIDGERWPVPNYSTNIAAAWLVVEKMSHVAGVPKWGFDDQLERARIWTMTSAEAALTICRAALIALTPEDGR
jgi:hypothetical protein